MPAHHLFITGATGFVGRHLLSRLARHGLEATCLLRPGASLPSQPPGVHVVRGELEQPETYEAALTAADVVVHLAARTGKARPDEYRRVNVEGTRELCAAAARAGGRPLVMASSIAAAFPDLRHYPYGRSKRDAEQVVRDAADRFLIVRPTMVLGPGSPVGTGLARLARAPRPILFGDGRTHVQPVHVEDLAESLARLCCEEAWTGDVLEIGGPETVTIAELLQAYRRAAGLAERPPLQLPAATLATVLAWVEPLLLPIIPITAGQLATFRWDGVARPDPRTARWLREFRGLSAMIVDGAARG